MGYKNMFVVAAIYNKAEYSKSPQSKWKHCKVDFFKIVRQKCLERYYLNK